MNLTRTQVAQIRETFSQFMVRENRMTLPQARYEFDEFLMAGALVPATREHYTSRVRRTGAAFTMTRAQRHEVFFSFENAINHVTF